MVICGQCQSQNTPKARFCAKCGAGLQATAHAAETAPALAEPRPAAVTDLVQARGGPISAAPLQTVAAAEPVKQKAKPAPRRKTKRAADAGSGEPKAGSAPSNRPLTNAVARAEKALTGESPVTDLQPLMHEEAKAKIAQDLLAPPDAVPLRLWLNFPRALVAGYGSIVEAKIENAGAGWLEHLSVSFESKGLKEAAEIDCHHLGPGLSTRQAVEVAPTQAGNFVLRCNVKSRRTADAAGFRGSVPITINVAPDASNLVVNISDIQCNRGTGANTGLGGDFAPVNISNVVPAGSIRTLNDLINATFPESFGQVPLEEEYGVTRRIINVVEDHVESGWSIPKAFLAHVQSGTKLKLEPVEKARQSDGSGELAAIHLIARDQFKLGRSREKADFLTWFWPRSPENDERTRRLSKLHVAAEFSAQRLILRDAGSANRSTFEGHPLSESENDVIDQRGTLILGHEYHLDIAPFESTITGDFQVSNIRMWSGPPERETPSIRGAVRFMPVNTELSMHNAVWIFTDANFGCSKLNALVLDIAGAVEVEGRFHYFRDNFWIETLSTGNGVTVGDHKLREHDVVPLVNGAQLMIAGHWFRASIEP
jgi:hypothetical protein